MKKGSLIFNIVLAVAVVVLYVLHFTSGNSTSTAPASSRAVIDSMTDISSNVVYVNIDSLFGNLDMFYDLRNDLMEKQKSSEATLNSKAKKFEENYLDLQNKVQKGLVTRSTAAEMEKQLATDQEDLMRLRDELQYNLAEEEQVMHRRMMNEIVEYLDEYNKQYGYQYILGHSYGGNILHANKNLDITAEVLTGLNNKYKENKTKK